MCHLFFNRHIRAPFIIAILLLLILLSAFRGESVGTDTLNYILHYQHAVSDSTWFRSSIEPGWYYLNKLSSLLGMGYRGAFLITITLVLSTIFFAARRFGAFKERLRKVKEGKAGLLEVLKGIGRLFITTEFAKQQPPERGYAYFQDFIPNNDSDIRVIIIDNKAFAVKRLVRENDFRASGSGRIIFDPSAIDRRCIEIAFSVNKKISAQSIGFDFVFNTKDEPEIVEFCYGFSPEPYDPCPGYWDEGLNWVEGGFVPQEWMLDSFLKRR